MRVSTLEATMEMFHAEREAAGKGAPDASRSSRDFIGRTGERIFANARISGGKYNVYVKWGQSGRCPKATAPDAARRVALRQFPHRSGKTCRGIRRHRDELGVDHMAFRVQWPGMPQELVLRTLERFAKEVMPEFV